MKINLTKQDVTKLLTLLQTKENNMDVSEMYLYYLTEASDSIKEKAILNLMKQRNLSSDRAFYYEFLKALEINYKDPDYIKANETCHVSNIKELDPSKYLDNPYYRNIKVNEIKSSSWYFKYDTLNAYEGFMYQDLEVVPEENYAEHSKLGFFTKPFKYLSVTQGDEIWMCITPHEIETMEKSIDEARGNVLVFGLGLGYYPYMISLKNTVRSITIIEKDKNAIELFTKYILPQFKNKEKITIIEADAFEYVKKHDISANFNYSFVDLWHNVDDGISLYIKMRSLTKDNKITHFSYWIETSLLVYLRRLLLSLIDEEAGDSTDEDYKEAENYDDELINKMHVIYKDKVIQTFDDIHHLISDEELKKLAEKLL